MEKDPRFLLLFFTTPGFALPVLFSYLIRYLNSMASQMVVMETVRQNKAEGSAFHVQNFLERKSLNDSQGSKICNKSHLANRTRHLMLILSPPNRGKKVLTLYFSCYLLPNGIKIQE